MSQAALIQHQCGYISQTTQQQAAAASTAAAAAAAALVVGANNHHLTHHNLSTTQNGTPTVISNKLPSHHQQHNTIPAAAAAAAAAATTTTTTTTTTGTGHGNLHQTNSHHQDRTSQQQQLAVHVAKKRRSGKNKIVTLLMKNADGEYECVSDFSSSLLMIDQLNDLAECSMSKIVEMSRYHCTCQSLCCRLAKRKWTVFKFELINDEQVRDTTILPNRKRRRKRTNERTNKMSIKTMIFSSSSFFIHRLHSSSPHVIDSSSFCLYISLSGCFVCACVSVSSVKHRLFSRVFFAIINIQH